MKLFVLAAVLAAAIAGPATAAAAAVVSMPLVLQAEHQNVTATVEQGGAAAFVYNPTLLTGTAKTAAIKSFGAAGSSSSRMAAQFPALSGFGLAQTYFELAPCANRAPHTHPFSSGLLYAIEATTLEVGFALEDASGAVVNNISTGASAVFPQGLLHYQQNRDCKNVAKFTISYNSDNPGTVNQAQALFALPTEIIAAALNATPAQAVGLGADIPTKNIYPGAISMSSDCVAACEAAGFNVTSQADTTSTALPTATASQMAAAASAEASTPAAAAAPAPAPQSAALTAAPSALLAMIIAGLTASLL